MNHLVVVLFLAGCPLTKPSDAGDTADSAERVVRRYMPLAQPFPYDGERRARYRQEGVDGDLIVEKTDLFEAHGVEIVEWTWSDRDDTAHTFGRLWISAGEDGVFVHAWEDADGAEHPCEPPIALAEHGDRLYDDAGVVTETAGYTFTVSLLGLEDCPVVWGLDFEECARIRVDDGDGDDATGPFFAGDWWLVERYGPAWMHLTGQAARWDLSRYEWSAG